MKEKSEDLKKETGLNRSSYHPKPQYHEKFFYSASILCHSSHVVPVKAPWCERQRHVVTSARMGTAESAAKCVALHRNRFSVSHTVFDLLNTI